ncbi:efflux RND transporter periplasmic adaptor subunit [Pantoea sp. B550]|uniref:efflux RND transporter periplasmic adaptor subunit n=1 Tax=Pantoea sp. B550 TaxID=2959338 RepID=UPI00209E7033|nr:efflux RND transporter periplasmic adaptor subunit [Pantoea sp. B550]MCP1204285.1 efflux RND transporter periplasmic adaptor subunit [Pantoea sp. B550]
MLSRKLFSLPLLLVALIAALTGCDEKAIMETEAPAPQVAIEVIQPQVLSVSETLPGRVNALHTAEIRPQVSGIIQRRLFEQGADIKKGMPLFQINAAPFEAEVASAQAGLLRAKAGNDKAQQQAARLRPLMKTGAVSRQSFDEAIANTRQTAADVAQASAALRRKALDLSFATVEAPISGRIDQALISEGAYVTASDSTPLARIYQTDPIYVDVHQPADVYHQLRQQAVSQQNAATGVPVKILLPGGAVYHQPGRILFSGMSVDPATGDVMVRIEVSNPDRELLPGMFVRVEILRQHYDDALLVPQQAVSLQEGHAALWVVDDRQQARQVNVHVGELIHGAYRIAEGLPAGSRVVVQGMDKLSNGTQVAAVISTASPANLTMKAGE